MFSSEIFENSFFYRTPPVDAPWSLTPNFSNNNNFSSKYSSISSMLQCTSRGNYHIISHDNSLKLTHLIFQYIMVGILPKTNISWPKKLTHKDCLMLSHVNSWWETSFTVNDIEKFNGGVCFYLQAMTDLFLVNFQAFTINSSEELCGRVSNGICL